MLKIFVFIKTIKQNKDVNVRFRIKDGAKADLSYKSDIVVNSLYWDKNSRCCIQTNSFVDQHLHQINQEIHQRKELLKSIYQGREVTQEVTSKWITDEVNRALYQKKQSVNHEQIPLIDEFERFAVNHDVSEARKAGYRTVVSCLRRFQQYYSFVHNTPIVFRYNDITYAVLEEFRQYIKNEHRLSEQYPAIVTDEYGIRSNNTVVGYLKKFRCFLNYFKLKYDQSYEPFKQYKYEKEKYGLPILMNQDEIELLHNVEIEDPQLRMIRDIFVFNMMTGFRISDLFNLKHTDVINSVIEYFPQKTRKFNIQVAIPLNRLGREIINKYKTKSPYLLPRMCLNTYREKLKELFSVLSITRPVTYLNVQTQQTEHVPLNKVVTPHLARRVFISTLLNMGYSDKVICAMSGNSPNSQEIKRYYRIEDEIKKNCVDRLDFRVNKDMITVLNYVDNQKNVNLFQQLRVI